MSVGHQIFWYYIYYKHCMVITECSGVIWKLTRTQHFHPVICCGGGQITGLLY